jgi:hypothetical protein
MRDFNRRAFLGLSVGAVSAVGAWPAAFAQSSCGSAPAFLPARLTVDCATRRNFRLFRQNTAYLGLAGVVSMTTVRGKWGTYPAGNLFLFPWLKPKGQALGSAKVWGAVLPTNTSQFMSAAPIKDATLPVDEYFCQRLLQAPANSFIGFLLDGPASKLEARLGLYTNIDKLADGKAVGVDWASSNLNNPWFGGNRQIPATDTCNGNAWRQLIIDGMNQASTALC